MQKKLAHVSENTFDELYENVEVNKDRYLSGDFTDLLSRPRTVIETNKEFSESALSRLNQPSRQVSGWDGKNSYRVFNCLNELGPAASTFLPIWVKLCHDELLPYARGRWLSGAEFSADNVRTHFFGSGRTGFRDDNAVGRLWWTGRIVESMYEGRGISALAECRRIQAVFMTAQRRFDTVERPRIFNQPDIARGVIRQFESGSLPGGNDTRDFMPKVNHKASGLVFSALDDKEADQFFDDCRT